MSLQLEFEPHSWYMGFGIKKTGSDEDPSLCNWYAYTADGMTYTIVEFADDTLARLKQSIREYHLAKRTGYGERLAKRRLESIRKALRAEHISYGELVELVSLTQYIEPGDVELLEAAGVPEK